MFPNWAHGKTLLEKIECGKTLVIKVTPIGDAWTNPSDKHTLKIYKIDSTYLIELIHNNESKKNTISKNQLIEISEFITKWKEGGSRFFSYGLSYDIVKMKIGMKTNRFRTSQYSDNDLITKYFKE